MSTTRFGVLARLALRHDWFGDGVLRGARFVLPEDTQRLLARGRLQARVHDDALHLLVERGDDSAPRVPLPEGSVVWIGVQPELGALAHVTQALAPPGQVALFDNRAAFDAFDAPRPLVPGDGFTRLSLAGLASPRRVSVFDAADREVMRRTIDHGDDEGTLDLRALPPGRYGLEASDGLAPLQRTELLLHPSLHVAPVVCALGLSAALYAAASPPTYTVAFRAPAQRLEYYVVARNFATNAFDQLAVSDRGFGDEGRAEIAFDRIAEADLDPATDLAPALLGAGPGVRIALFRSRAALARRQRAPRRLSLDRNGDTLIEHLPAPGAERALPRFVIHLAQP